MQEPRHRCRTHGERGEKNNWARLATTQENRPTRCKPIALKACSESKRSAIETATRYYERELPERLAREKQTLANSPAGRWRDRPHGR